MANLKVLPCHTSRFGVKTSETTMTLRSRHHTQRYLSVLEYTVLECKCISQKTVFKSRVSVPQLWGQRFDFLPSFVEVSLCPESWWLWFKKKKSILNNYCIWENRVGLDSGTWWRRSDLWASYPRTHAVWSVWSGNWTTSLLLPNAPHSRFH